MQFFYSQASIFLNFCKKCTGIDIQYFLKNGAWMAGERGFLIAKGFVVSLLLANFVEKEIFGQYNFIISLLGILAAVSLPGMSVAITQAVARGQEGTFVFAIKSMLKWGILGSIILLGITIFSTYTSNPSWQMSLLLVPFFPFYSIMTIWKSYYFGKEDFAYTVRKTIIVEFFMLVALISVVFWHPTVFFLVSVAVFVPLVFYWQYIVRIIKRVQQSAVDMSNLTYGRNISFLYAILIISNCLDMVFVGHFVGFIELAGYTIAVLIPEQIKSGMRMLTTLTLPRFSKMDDTRENQKKIIKNIAYLFLATTGAIIIYIFCAPWIFQWFFPKYTDFVSLSRFTALGFIVTPFLVFDSFFKAQKDQKVITYSTLTSSIVSIVLMFALVPLFGLWGAAIARISNTVIFALILCVAFIKKMYINKAG